jgi:hypothetical protein
MAMNFVGKSGSVVIPLCALLLHGCASKEALVSEHFDTVTGTTFATAGRAQVYARTDIRYSRSARDYLYLGPVETNRQGLLEYYLWVGVGTTLDRGYLAPEQAPPTALRVLVSGELMEFELKPWHDIAGMARGASLYTTPVRPSSELVARITLHQLELMAGRAPASVDIVVADGQSRAYERWDDGPAWPDFIRHAGGEPARFARRLDVD